MVCNTHNIRESTNPTNFFPENDASKKIKASVRHKFDISLCFSVSVLVHQEQTKGGLILKGLFGILEFFLKTNEWMIHRMKFVHSPVIKKKQIHSFGNERIVGLKKHYDFVWPLSAIPATVVRFNWIKVCWGSRPERNQRLPELCMYVFRDSVIQRKI